MSEFRTRRFVPVPPAARPRRERRAVRVIITDGSAVLLFADTDPGLPGSRWWVTPGGGMDIGETPIQAALREVAEETGLRVEPEDLIGPIMTRTVVHGYSDQILSQHETFFVLGAARFGIDTSGHTPAEQLTLQGHAWIDLADLADRPEPVWPADLLALLAVADRPQEWPLDGGVVEESTLPVGVLASAPLLGDGLSLTKPRPGTTAEPDEAPAPKDDPSSGSGSVSSGSGSVSSGSGSVPSGSGVVRSRGVPDLGVDQGTPRAHQAFVDVGLVRTQRTGRPADLKGSHSGAGQPGYVLGT